MTGLETISVIIPVYNSEKYLDRCIQSVVDQTYKNLEIILINDGSNDCSGEICDEWEKKDNRIRVIHKSNGGASDARNVGIDEATGAYIGFVDSDDYIHPEMYQKLYNTKKRFKVAMATCGYHQISEVDGFCFESKKPHKAGLISKKEALLYLCREVPFMVLWNKLYDRELFSNLRFPKGKMSEDVYILPYIYDKCNNSVCISECLYYYVMTPNSITRSVRTVAYMDSVEAYYNMLLLCEDKGYTDLLNVVSSEMVKWYLGTRAQIEEVRPGEKRRMREIKRMVRYGYLKYGKNIRTIHKLEVEFPALCELLRLAKRAIVSTNDIKT